MKTPPATEKKIAAAKRFRKLPHRPVHSVKFALAMILFLIVIEVEAQDRVLTGVVRSKDDNQSLPGVNVLVKGTSKGTVTDLDGNYNLAVSDPAPTLVFSFVGMKSLEVEVDERAVIDIQLESDTQQLSEIIVTGTGVPVDKRNLAFAAESTTTDKLPPVPTASIDQSLVGRIAGAQISSVTGTPGAEVNILLRGINSINTTTQPMILVDGIQMGATSMSGIDPNSIEKVEVIQGAAASTIYGAQGANGVIQLFTKRGKNGKTRIEFSSGVSMGEILNVGGLRKAQLHSFKTNANNEVIDPATGRPISLNDTTLLYDNLAWDISDTARTDKPFDRNLRYVDHFKMFFKPAMTYTARLGISGGGEYSDYNVSISKVRQESNFNPGTYNDRTNFTLNLGLEVMKGLHLRSVTQLIHTINTIDFYEKPDFGGNGNEFLLFNTRPFVDFSKRDIEGNYGSYFGRATGANALNPFYEHQYTSTSDKRLDVLQNIDITYSPSGHFDFELLYGINYQTRKVRYDVQNQSLNRNSNESNTWSGFNAPNNEGEMDIFEIEHSFQNAKAVSTARYDLQKDFGWNIPVGSITQVAFDYRDDDLAKYQSYALGMPVFPPRNAAQGNTFAIPEDSKQQFVTYGYLVNQRFTYSDLAGLSAGFRSDFSSAFGKGSKPFTFPRADGFFRLSGLKFWDDTPWLNQLFDLKLRAAYGEAGIQPRPFDRYVTLSSRPLGSSSALYIGTNQSNPNLSVEVSKEFETGADLTVDGFKGAWLKTFQLGFTYWKRDTNNGIVNIDASPSSGFGSVIDNALSIGSNGLQLTLQTPVLKTEQWSWTLTANLSRQRSYYADIKGGQMVVDGVVVTNGAPIGSYLNAKLMLHSVNQIDPKTGEPFISPALQSDYEVASNGWVVNKNTKAAFVSAGMYSQGDPNPNFMMTIMNDLTFRRYLTLSVQVDWINGNMLHNLTKQWLFRDGIHSDFEKPLTINNQTGAWTAFYNSLYAGGRKSYMLEDGSFARLRNLSLGFDFAPLLQLKKFEKVQLVLTGRNLLTWTTFSGMDPEVNSDVQSNFFATATSLARGRDNFSLPNIRSYQLTLNLTF
jgi:TonB-linked SusC/RagA family outer membrane protein